MPPPRIRHAPRTARRRSLAAAALACTLALIACKSPTLPVSSDPVAEIERTDAPVSRRVAAVDKVWARVESGQSDREAARAALKRVLFLFSVPDAARLRAAEKLLSDATEPGIEDTRRVFALRLPRETNWDIVRLISTAAADRGWTEFNAPLVRSYSRQVVDPPDAQRPERAALLKLNPGKSLVEIAYGVFMSHPGATIDRDPTTGVQRGNILHDRVRTDAWELLGRLDADGSVRSGLLAADPRAASAAGDPLLEDLQAAARDLRAIPITGPELEWVRSLRGLANPTNAQWWAGASAATAALSPHQSAGLQVRHAEPIRWAARYHPEWLAATRDDLRAELAHRLRGRATHKRELASGAGRDAHETIDAHDHRLAWGDLLAILVLEEALRHPRVVAQLFDQADQDRKNTMTEYGGALEAAGDSEAPVFEARLFPPRGTVVGGDTVFVASQQMIDSTPRALAHYHFHVQKARNARAAGPSAQDIEYAATYGRNCLVFTSIRQGVLGADYYQRNGAVIDLGEVSR